MSSTNAYVNALQGSGLPTTTTFGEKGLLPSSFRTSRVLPLPITTKNPVNTLGLDTLNVSGSSQFSEHELDTIISNLGTKKITVINLRQEDMGFVESKQGSGAIPFSYIMPMPWWTGEDPRGLRSVKEIERSEDERMAEITRDGKLQIFGCGDGSAPKDAHEVEYQVDIDVKRALTEKQLVESKKLGYHRIPDKKFGHMQDEHVEDFVHFLQNLPTGQHVHFHCKKGQSRTTLFMIAYDIWFNADKVSCEDIIRRQGPDGLGGVDMMKVAESKGWDQSFKKGWVDFLKDFHRYVKEQKPGGCKLSWSEWKKEKGIKELPPIKTRDFYKDGPSVRSNLPESKETYTGPVLAVNTINEAKQSVPNFRSTQDRRFVSRTLYNANGLYNYFASGSAQYSEAELTNLIDKLKKTGKKVVIMDLRHDDHLYVDGMNMSAFETVSALLQPRTPEEIKASIKQLQTALKAQQVVQARGLETKYPRNEYDTRYVLTIKPRKIETPEELVTRLGAHYHLVGSKRFSGVSDDDVDGLIKLYREMGKDTWYHVNCKKGKSRTTLFSVILDMMHNAHQVRWDEIIHRQWEIGGVNLFDVTPKDPSWADEKENKIQWITFMARFHKYCQENMKTNFALSWSEWSKQNADYQPAVRDRAIDTTSTKS